MRMRRMLPTGALMLIWLSGCQPKLKEIRSETKFGPSFQHRGSDRTDSTRWTAQQGIEFKWNKGVKTGITYRRRDTDDGNGNNDNAVFIDFSFPIWKAEKKPDPLKKRIKKLERRVAELEALLTASEEKSASP